MDIYVIYLGWLNPLSKSEIPVYVVLTLAEESVHFTSEEEEVGFELAGIFSSTFLQPVNDSKT